MRIKRFRATPTSRSLTLEDAIQIWRRRRAGIAIHRIAAEFEVNPARIEEILKGKRFSDAEAMSLV